MGWPQVPPKVTGHSRRQAVDIGSDDNQNSAGAEDPAGLGHGQEGRRRVLDEVNEGDGRIGVGRELDFFECPLS